MYMKVYAKYVSLGSVNNFRMYRKPVTGPCENAIGNVRQTLT